jgi:hypothetical protein
MFNAALPIMGLYERTAKGTGGQLLVEQSGGLISSFFSPRRQLRTADPAAQAARHP